MKFNIKAYILNCLAAGSCVVVIMPILTVREMMHPWEDALKLLQDKYPNDIYIPLSSHVDGVQKLRETNYLILPSNMTTTIRQEHGIVDYSESQGGLITNVIGFTAFLLFFIFFGIPRIITMFRNIENKRKKMKTGTAIRDCPS